MDKRVMEVREYIHVYKYFIYMYGNAMMRPINIHNNKFITENHRVLDSEGLEWCLRPCLHPAQVTMAPLSKT